MATQKDKYPTEVIFVDNDGVRCPAKIVGYNEEGKLPDALDGEVRIPAKDAELNLKTLGIENDADVGPKEAKAPATITEYRVSETKSGTKDPRTGKEIVGLRPIVDLMVNRGTSKTGPKWNLVTGVSHGKHIMGRHQMTGKLGAVTNAKRYFLEVEAPKVDAAKK